MLHVLLHMANHGAPQTSQVLAEALDTNPVVVRRTLAGLRDRGYVRSEKGHGGGWMLACDLSEVTLLDIYEALGCHSLLAVGNRKESSPCAVEQAVNSALGHAFAEAEAVLLSRLGEVTLEMLRAEIPERERHQATITSRHSHAL